MVDKNFCLSSYMAFRYIWKDGMEFYPGFRHRKYQFNQKQDLIPVYGASDIDAGIKVQIDKLYQQYDNIGIMLSGGMDSAILAAYLKPGSHAYTFTSDTDVFDEDLNRARYYCSKYGLVHHLVPVSFEDYKKYTPIVVANNFMPVHSIEPQIYKAAIMAKKDGVEVLVTGESADGVFGGLDGLLSKDWTLGEFMQRYNFLDPSKVLSVPVDQTELYKKYLCSDGTIDVISFISDVFCIESGGSYQNAFAAAKMPYYVPYANFKLSEPLDIERIRKGESKYFIRALYAMKYPEREIPEKIPMPRPVDEIFRNWSGPQRSEFRKDIDMSSLTGNQKWQLWCAELFLNLFD